MHIKQKYIDAIVDAIDFVSNRVDGADEGKDEKEMLDTLHELQESMKRSYHKTLVNYYVKKETKRIVKETKNGKLINEG